jgi:Peptidase M66
VRIVGVGRTVVSLALVALVALLGGAVAGLADVSSVRVLVVKVTWGPQPFTDNDVDAAMQTATQFYTTASYGKVALTYSQTPWITSLSGPPACSNASDVAALIPQLTALAANAGYSGSTDDRTIFLLPSASCGFLGITQSGGIVLNGTIEAGAVIHELGHTFGMGHAGAFACRYTPSNKRFCTSDPYGDLWDVMGSSLDFAPTRPTVGSATTSQPDATSPSPTDPTRSSTGSPRPANASSPPGSRHHTFVAEATETTSSSSSPPPPGSAANPFNAYSDSSARPTSTNSPR